MISTKLISHGDVAAFIVDGTGTLLGRITLNGIVRGTFQSCSLGYWVGAADNGPGVATAAVGSILRLVFGALGLHRIQAETLLHNVRSQRILEHNGFVRIGMAPNYLKIAGAWQDFNLYQIVQNDGGKLQSARSRIS
ncbi:GNAT family N-acetyltransferase [Paeniglutamicibacter antarcticus]|uniref:GNAT family N-acetyltransferase n=1 Tax=Arthrobacter terrae TaxID=2935737 RepID=A0A931CJ44_9MICC|nr:GNAT family protein [Arthrobacter terrae]MBG0739552.1 GNAT family N-acetyltransferase [Arthrobacter terrae]